MGYKVRKVNSSKRSWRIQYVSFVGSEKARDVPESEWFNLGITNSLSIDEVKVICKKLNSSLELKRIQEKRNSIAERIKIEDLKLNSSLPDVFIQEFEKMNVKIGSKTQSHWRVCKKILIEIQIDCQDWCFYKDKFYKYFVDNNYSYSYCQKLIYLLNKWGDFISYKKKCYFKPIPFPRSIDKEKIIDNHEEEKGIQESLPLTWNLLQSNESKFKSEHYNWLYLSLWLGLRPIECDQLLKAPSKTTWELDEVENTTILWIYQSKLSGIAKSRRMKPIPFKYPEQVKCLEIIKSGEFKRPLNKTIKLHLHGQYTCYTGRKGFTDLMLSKGNSLESISQWLGHQTIDRTWRNYKDKKKVLI